MNKDELKSAIDREFGKLEYPGDSKLVPKFDFERDQLYEDFRGKHWKDISLDLVIPMHMDDMFLFTDEAYRFYLPGYMILIIDNFDECDRLSDAIVHSLDSKFMLEYQQDFYDLMAGFTNSQKQVIRYFLEYLKENSPPPEEDIFLFFKKDVERALEYWQQF